MNIYSTQKNDNPKISICVPTFNRSGLLKKTLLSVTRQTVSPYEVIVADNCSEDDTEQVAKSFPNVVYYRNERNLGLAGNSNKCIQFAGGDFVTILHSDDLIAPNWHEYWLSLLKKHKDSNIAVFFSSVFTIDINDRAKIVYRILSSERLLAAREAFNVLWSRNMCALPASGGIIFRKSIFNDIGGYVEELSTEADALLVLRILNNYPIFHSPKLLYAFRIHSLQTSDLLEEEKTIEKKLKILERHLGIFKDFYNTDLRAEYKRPMFYKRVAFMYIAIGLFHFLMFKKDLASRYYRLTKNIFPDIFNCLYDYFVFITIILHYIRKLIWGRILALPIRKMAYRWVKD